MLLVESFVYTLVWVASRKPSVVIYKDVLIIFSSVTFSYFDGLRVCALSSNLVQAESCDVDEVDG